MIEHKLKTWPSYFTDIEEGRKTFELRKNDRDFRVGDVLVLQEYTLKADLDTQGYTGAELRCEVVHIMHGAEKNVFGLAPGYLIMSIKKTGNTTINHDLIGVA